MAIVMLDPLEATWNGADNLVKTFAMPWGVPTLKFIKTIMLGKGLIIEQITPTWHDNINNLIGHFETHGGDTISDTRQGAEPERLLSWLACS